MKHLRPRNKVNLISTIEYKRRKELFCVINFPWPKIAIRWRKFSALSSKVFTHTKIDNQVFYKIKWVGYDEITEEPETN